jgi:tyrosine-protein kinase Etk/Wzc
MEQHRMNLNQVWDDENEEKGLDFKKLMNKAISLWPWMILCILIMGLVAITYLYFASPGYKINAKILIKDDDKKTGGTMGDLSMLQSIGILSGASSVDNELEIIQSYSLMHEVVNVLQLNVTVSTYEKLKHIEKYDRHNPFSIQFLKFNISNLKTASIQYDIQFLNKNRIQLNGVDNDESYKLQLGDTIVLQAGTVVISENLLFEGKRNDSYKMTVSEPDMVTKDYMQSLEASIPNKQVSTINLTFSCTIPRKGEKIINTLINAYMQANVDDNNRIADSTMNFIDSRLLVVGDQLTDIEKRIQVFKQENDVADLTEQAKILISNTGDYAKQVAEQQVQLSVIESLEKYLKENIGNERIVPASLMIQDPTLIAVTTQYNQLLMQRSRLLLGTTDNNPMIKNIDGQLSDLRYDMLKGISSVKHSSEAALSSLKSNSGKIESQIRQVPAKERVYLDFSRQQQIRQELFLFLLQKREETAISRSSTIANARIIDAAQSDDKPFEPKKKLIFAFAILLGAVLPFGIVYIRDVLNTRIKTKEDIEAQTKIPIVGEIGHNDDAAFIAVSKKSRTLIAEQFRALRANLQFLFTNEKDKVIMMTSSMSGEGKSFIATNLAMVFALADKKVVLLELDLRKPKIMSSLELKFDKGFSQYAIGSATLDEIIYPSGINENLFIIPAGPIPPNPSELILHERTTEMFRALREKFDYIIVDTTPNLVSDAQLLSIHANTTLYVARLDYTHKEQLRIPDRLEKQGKLPKLNLIINDIKPKKYGGGYYGYGYGGYGYGGYGYGYGEYIQGNKSKANRLKKILKN